MSANSAEAPSEAVTCRGCADRQARLDVWERDIAAAAGDLPVNLPEPGSDAARLLIANKLLHQRVRELEAAIVAAKVGSHA